jgi:hypothetical protein
MLREGEEEEKEQEEEQEEDETEESRRLYDGRRSEEEERARWGLSRHDGIQSTSRHFTRYIEAQGRSAGPKG